LGELPSLSNRYSTLGLERNPFPSIPVFSLFTSQRYACCQHLFQRQLRCLSDFFSQSEKKRGVRVFFINGERGSGKSAFLFELSNQNNSSFFPVFVQAFTTGGFSDLLDRYLEWMGFRGYISNIIDIMETLGINLEKETLVYNRKRMYDHVLSRVAATGENVDAARRIFQVLTDLEDGFCKLFKTSRKAEIFATLMNLLRNTKGKRPLIIMDNLENRWEAMPGYSNSFIEKLEEFDEATHFKCNYVFSSAALSRNQMEESIIASSLCRVSCHRRLLQGTRYYRTSTSKLTIGSIQKVILEYLTGARSGDKKRCNGISPFTFSVVKRLVKATKGNLRQVITFSHDIVEDAAIRKQNKITCFNVDCVASANE